MHTTAHRTLGRLTSVCRHLPRGPFPRLPQDTQPYMVQCGWLQSIQVVAVRLRSQDQGLFLAT